MDDIERENLRQKDTNDRRTIREDLGDNEKDNLRQQNSNERKIKREDLNDSDQELIRLLDTYEREIARTQLSFSEREKIKSTDRTAKRSSRSEYSYMVKMYEQEILKGLNNICVCCGGLFFERTLVDFDEEKEKQQKSKEFLDKIIVPHKITVNFLFFLLNEPF